MLMRQLVSGGVLTFLTATLVAQEPVDSSMVAKIRAEAFER